jgi:hypothetical protein
MCQPVARIVMVICLCIIFSERQERFITITDEAMRCCGHLYLYYSKIILRGLKCVPPCNFVVVKAAGDNFPPADAARCHLHRDHQEEDYIAQSKTKICICNSGLGLLLLLPSLRTSRMAIMWICIITYHYHERKGGRRITGFARHDYLQISPQNDSLKDFLALTIMYIFNIYIYIYIYIYNLNLHRARLKSEMDSVFALYFERYDKARVTYPFTFTDEPD